MASVTPSYFQLQLQLGRQQQQQQQQHLRSPPLAGGSRRVSLAPSKRTGRLLFSLRASDSGGTNTAAEALKPAISLTEKALQHLRKLKGDDANKDLYLRVGVRQGGCSGMSYTMDFEQRGNVHADDSLIEYEGFTMVCDPKSLLFLYGMQLDYSDALIGGGFSFQNPNASSTCGCGKSFAA